MSAVVQVGVAVLLLVAPGYVLALASGARGWLAAALAPGLTLGAVYLLSLLLRALGVSWSVASAGWSVLVVVLVVGAATRQWRNVRGSGFFSARGLVPAVAVAAAGSLGGVLLDRATHGLTRVNQSWDAIFHAGAIRYIADSGDTSPSALAFLSQPANSSFYYPNNYHVLGALYAQLTGASATTTVNVLAAALPAVFALGVAGLLGTFGARTHVIALGGVLAVSISAFPYNIIAFGALLPFATAIAALPAVIAGTQAVVRTAGISVAAMTGVAALGVIATHPSVGVIAALWCAVHVLVVMVKRSWWSWRAVIALAVVAVVSAIGSLPLLSGLSSSAEVASSIKRDPFTDGAGAVGQLWFFSTNIGDAQWWVGAALVVGAAACYRNRTLWSTYLVAGVITALYVLSAAFDSNLTALWWDDYSRFAALFVVPAVVFAAFGLGALVDGLVQVVRWSATVVRRPRLGGSRWVRGAALGLVVVVFGLVTFGFYAERQVDYVRLAFTNGPTLSTGEEAAFTFLARQPPGGTILNDPGDGSAYAYAIDGLPVLFKTPITPPINVTNLGRDRLLLFGKYRYKGTDPAVAAAAKRLDVRWVITGAGFLVPTMKRAPGLVDLTAVPGLTKVFDNGTSQVYRVDAGSPA